MEHARLKIYAALGQAGGRIFDVDLPQSCCLLDLLRSVADEHGFTQQLFETPDRLKPSYTVLVNGTSVYYLEGANTLIHAGDEIAVLAFVTGG
jgi:molybdopterin converting factor small subunit